MNRIISICMWNIQGVQSSNTGCKLEMVETNEKLKQFDIVGLVETHSHDQSPINIKGYKTLAQVNRPKTQKARKYSGGVAALVKDKISEGISYVKSPNIEQDIVWLKLSKFYFHWENDLYIAFIYISPEYSSHTVRENPQYFEKLESDIAYFSSRGKVSILGDFNARTGQEPDYIVNDADGIEHIPLPSDYIPDRPLCNRLNQDKTANNYGKSLLNVCQSSGMRILNGRYIGDSLGQLTCHQYNGSSMVDYCIVHHTLLPYILCFKVHDWCATISDHCLISFAIAAHHTLQPRTEIPMEQPKNQYKWDSESGDKFKTVLQDKDIQGSLKCITESSNIPNVSAEDLLAKFSKVLYTAADRSLRQKKKFNKKIRKQKWFDKSCADLKRECKSLANMVQNQPNNVVIRQLFFTTKKRYKKLLKKCKRDFKISILSKLENSFEKNPSAYWKIVDELKNMSADPKSDKIDPSTWYSYFKDLFSVTPPTNPSFDESILKQIEKLEKQNVFNELNFRILPSEVDGALKNLKNGKAAGLDGIMNEMLKTGADIFCKPLTVLFNKFFVTGNYPNEWSLGVITPIHKSSDLCTPGNYRGITLCSNLAKIYSTVLNSRLVKFLENHNINSPEQIGFKRKARTADHMFVLKCLIDKYIAPKGGCLYTCFVDMRKAFDKVWWHGLFYKLLKCNIGGNFYKTIKNMYSTVTSCVKTSGGLTPAFSVYQGVRQGETFSPTLFNLYLNDLPSNISVGCTDPVELGSRPLQCMMYADDIILLSTTKGGLQCCLNNLYDYCARWKLEVNLMKTKIIIFNKNGRLFRDKFLYGNRIIECVKTYKYLGLEFDNTGSFNLAKQNLRQKAMKASFKLKQIIDANSLSPKISMSLFNTLIKPIALYGSEVWGATLCAPTATKSMSNLELLPAEKVHLSFARYILGVHKNTTSAAVRGELGLYPLGLTALNTVFKYQEHVSKAPPLSLLTYAVTQMVSMGNNHKCWLSHISKTSQWAGQYGRFQKCKNIYRDLWQKSISGPNCKLRTYALFKTNINFENYLNLIPNSSHRKALTQLRTSSHKLAIETGRYCKPKKALEERICTTCDAVENEIHFLIKCPRHSNERTQLYKEVTDACPNFLVLSDEQKFLYLVTSEGKIIKATAKFCHLSFEKHNTYIHPVTGQNNPV